MACAEAPYRSQVLAYGTGSTPFSSIVWLSMPKDKWRDLPTFLLIPNFANCIHKDMMVNHILQNPTIVLFNYLS